MTNAFCLYARVSSKVSQRVDGLGIAAQLQSMRSYVSRVGGVIVAEYVEAESGANDDRQVLKDCISNATETSSTILVARLDRISRDACFIFNLRKANVAFRCVDMPEADAFQISLFAVLAEREKTLIGLRTKAALAAAKSRGIKLGTPNPVRSVSLMTQAARNEKVKFATKMRPIIREIMETGVSSYSEVARCLNRRGIITRQKKEWHAETVKRILALAA
jgi:DNA invertase Pin-like site-specific DNA recombinase